LAKTLKQGKKIREKKKNPKKAEKMPKIAEMRKKVKNRTNHAGPNANPVVHPFPMVRAAISILQVSHKFQNTPTRTRFHKIRKMPD
jgi:hypothetical protein